MHVYGFVIQRKEMKNILYRKRILMMVDKTLKIQLVHKTFS